MSEMVRGALEVVHTKHRRIHVCSNLARSIGGWYRDTKKLCRR